MNNKQFRSLLTDETKPSDSSASSSTRVVLGGRRHGHATTSADTSFAQSVRERSSFLKPKKQFKSSAPKGSKIAEGYVDRARARAQGTEDNAGEDERAKRIKALEAQLKEKKISQSTFEAARDAITAGDISATHLVKGLDRQLLERVRQGENVMSADIPQTAEDNEVDDELDKIEVSDTQRIKKSTTVKQGLMASNIAAGRKRTRDEILAELKARRTGESAPVEHPRSNPQPVLNDRWRRVNEQQKSRIEIDCKGREVLVIVDEDGIVKKKLRKPAAAEERKEELVIGRNLPGEVLGADIKLPLSAPQQDSHEAAEEEEDGDDDIFEGVGTDYDPLGGDETASDEDGESGSDDDDDDDADNPPISHADESGSDDNADLQHKRAPVNHADESRLPATEHVSTKRNYFNDKANENEQDSQNHFKGVEAVIAKAARLASEQKDQKVESEEDKAAALRRAKHAAMINTHDRDMDDLDLGFGGSRFEDGEDEEAGKGMRLSEWSGAQHDDKDRPRKDRRKKGDHSKSS